MLFPDPTLFTSAAGAVIDPGGARDLLAEIALKIEALHARILAVRLAQHGKGAVAAAVVDENHLPAGRDLFDDRRHPLQKEGDRLFLIIDGNDQADLRPASARGFETEIGRASWRERVGQYV